ncbi:hypothetical protein [Histophilus somni]|uniref:hypothetical protein n=1 Tax=Histophilus somni TaxID=731 RepID=UPI0038783F3C
MNMHLKKTSAEPQNSNIRQLANSSTPLNRAFFIRTIRTSQINPFAYGAKCLISMVAYHGKGFALCCVPVDAVSELMIRCRQYQSLRTLRAVTPIMTTGVTLMIYKFILLGKNRLHLSIFANNEQQARNRVNLSNAICYARINPKQYRTLSGNA